MGFTNLYQRKPPGASCNWTKEELAAGAPYRWWRSTTSQGCTLGKLYISTQVTSGQFPALAVKAPSASWWTGGPGGGWRGAGTEAVCASANGYLFNSALSEVQIDIWDALADGIWTSSVTFDFICSYNSTLPLPVNPSVYATSIFSSGSLIGGVPSASAFVLTSVLTACPSSGWTNSVTVYDDGRITIT